MKVLIPANIETEQKPERHRYIEKIRSILLTWEIYPLFFLAFFLRLYHIDATSFNDDEANVFRFAREAVTHGFIPLTSNPSSVGTMNPPLMIYLTMIPAALSANPVWAEVMTGFLDAIAVILTYFFVRRYYGRIAGIIASLLFATSIVAIAYSRFIWPQNFLPFFTVLFLIIIFRGAIEQRKGWLAPALLLVIVQYQLHGTGIFLMIPLALAVLLAWRTIRWRDILWCILGLVILFSTFIFWEFKSHFSDITILLHSTGATPQIDSKAIGYYFWSLTPLLNDLMLRQDILPTYATSMLASPSLAISNIFLKAVHKVMPILMVSAIIFSLLKIIFPLRGTETPVSHGRLSSLLNWWSTFTSSPYRKGLILLLSWQIIPLLLLTRHSIPLYPHYFIIFFPGQFILIALFLSWVIEYVSHFRPAWKSLVRYGVGAFAIIIIGSQILGSFAAVADNATGNFQGFYDPYHYFNDATSLRRATTAADQLAQQQHIGRVYISSVFAISSAMIYLSEQMHTPTTVFDASNCYILPGEEVGKVVFLAEPNNAADITFISTFAQATLVQSLPRLAGPPFQLYILQTKPASVVPQQAFSSDLQASASNAIVVPSTVDTQEWVTTRWRINNTLAPALRTKYQYTFQMQANNSWKDTATCGTTRLWAGDQLFAFHDQTKDTVLPAQLQIEATFAREVPIAYHSLGLTFLSYKTEEVDTRALYAPDGRTSLTFNLH